MSRETMEWLHTMTKIGFNKKAWHFRDEDEASRANHYPGPVPIEHIERDLFNWEPEVMPLAGLVGPTTGRVYSDPDKIAIGHPDTGALFGTFTTGYKVHGYHEWLINNISTILDADVKIASAGLLRKGAVAWVTVSMADTLEGAGGVEFRPYLTAATSLDGSISTTYQQGVILPVCDNFLAAALSEKGVPRIKVRHTSGSLSKIGDVRQALKILHTTSDDFQTELDNLLSIKVRRPKFLKWCDAYAELTKEKEAKGGRGATMAVNKRDQLIDLWDNDDRVSPWAGSAFGVLQTANTYEHWFAGTRGQTKPERNFTRMVYGQVANVDAHALRVLEAV